MSVTDFLYNGKPPPSVNTYGSTTNSVPQWLSDSVQGTFAKANAVAGQPYQPYVDKSGHPLQRVAAPNDAMKSGWATTMAGADSYKPEYGMAAQSINGTMDDSALGVAKPYLDDAAKGWDSNAANQYMSPYIDSVVNRIGDLGNRNLTEKILPGINDDFIRAGQYGSTPMMETVGRGIRDTQESISAAQSNALNTGYTGAQSAFQADKSREAGIGQVAGNFSSADTTNQLATGAAQMKLGTANQTAAVTSGAAQEAVGNSQRAIDQQNLDVAHQDFMDAKNYPIDMLKLVSGVQNGAPNVGGTTYTTKTGPADVYQPSGLAQVAGAAALANGISNLKLKRGGRVKPSKDDPIILEGEIAPPPMKKNKSYRTMGV
jgi:hypothetical protein